MDKKKLALYAAIGGGAAFIGCLMPWVSISGGPLVSRSENAMSGGFDAGILVLLLSLAGGALAALTATDRTKMIPMPAKTQLLTAGGCLAVALLFVLINFFKEFRTETVPLVGTVGASRGIGLWISLLGTLAGTASMFMLLKQGGMLPKVDVSGDDSGGDDSGDGDSGGEDSGDGD